MAFLHPWLLLGLAAAAIPVILHLVQRREPPTVPFPAVRYLQEATREHQRRLRIQHWLLLLVRTLLLILLVLAAAGPTVPRRGVAGHAPSAVVLVLDNSASSSAVAGGTARLEGLKAATRAVLERATPSDHLWLMTADGVPRGGDPATLLASVNDAVALPRRLDLGAAVSTAQALLEGQDRPAEVMLISDLQRTALTAAEVRIPLTVARPVDAAPRNAGIAALMPAAQPWSTDGGQVSIEVVGDSGMRAPLSVSLDGRTPRQVLAEAGVTLPVAVGGAAPGWRPLVATLEPDEFRLDDRRVVGVRVAPLAQADCAPGGRFVAAACEVLVANGRLARGSLVAIDHFGAAGSVILPPDDPARVGALNRELERRGKAWRFGAMRGAATVDSSAVLAGGRIVRRLELVPTGSGRTGVLATAGGAPWLVRDGDIVLAGSRLDTSWTDLPLTAAFVPFIDLLLNRLARGEYASLDVGAGNQVPLPDMVGAVVHGARQWTVEGGGAFTPPDTGLYFLLGAGDTVGALAANLDARESLLAPASDRDVRSLWRGARVVPLAEAGAMAFAAGARSDLRGPLLWAALALGLVELVLASAWGRRA